MDTSYDSWER
jgi:hypothetical protein